jgi:hypothetical protein
VRYVTRLQRAQHPCFVNPSPARRPRRGQRRQRRRRGIGAIAYARLAALASKALAYFRTAVPVLALWLPFTARGCRSRFWRSRPMRRGVPGTKYRSASQGLPSKRWFCLAWRWGSRFFGTRRIGVTPSGSRRLDARLAPAPLPSAACMYCACRLTGSLTAREPSAGAAATLRLRRRRRPTVAGSRGRECRTGDWNGAVTRVFRWEATEAGNARAYRRHCRG